MSNPTGDRLYETSLLSYLDGHLDELASPGEMYATDLHVPVVAGRLCVGRVGEQTTPNAQIDLRAAELSVLPVGRDYLLAVEIKDADSAGTAVGFARREPGTDQVVPVSSEPLRAFSLLATRQPLGVELTAERVDGSRFEINDTDAALAFFSACIKTVRRRAEQAHTAAE